MSKIDLAKVLGPLSKLFEDPDVNMVMVDGPQRVTIEKYDGIEETGITFQSDEEVKKIIESILKSVGVKMEENRSIYDVRLTDNSRLTAVLAPTALTGSSFIVRKWMTSRITWEKMLEYQVLSPGVRDLLQSAINAHTSMLIAGGTGSGKTTLTNRIAELIRPEERILAVEQIHELQFVHPRAIFLEADDAIHTKLDDLLTAGSKMRPDWLVVGDMIGAEAMRTMQIFSNGHTGITTIHADGVEDALTRLETMCLMANLGLGLEDIRKMIASALKLVIYQECLVPNGRRKITHICELRGLENGHYILQPLMHYDAAKDAFEMTGAQPGWQK